VDGGVVTGPSTPDRGARGYSWPPFEVGNTAAMTHGARSPRIINPRAAEIVEWWLSLPDLLPHLREESRRPLLFLAGQAWARVERYAMKLEAMFELGDDADPDEVLATERELIRAEGVADKRMHGLGLPPAVTARITKDTATSRYMATAAMAGVERLIATGAVEAARDIAAIEAQAVESPVEALEGGSDAIPA
jgi:hypothetical protein